MKWSLIGLFALGFVAATCAVLLVISLRQPAAGTEGGAGAEVEEATRIVLVASRDLDTRHVVAAEDLRPTEVAVSALPQGGFFSDAVQTVGQVLVAPMTEGQPFTPQSFPPRGSSMQLATTLTRGMRAVTIMITDDRVTERMLYPGCLVDVVANLDLDPGAERELAAFTLLENLLVLGVGDRSIVKPEGDQKESTVETTRYSVVTLLVDPEQAARLSLVQKEGTFNLVLRNPLDNAPHTTEPVRLVSLLSTMEEQQAAEGQPAALARTPTELERIQEQVALLRAQRELRDAKHALEGGPAPDEPEADEASGPEVWNTLILRGGQSETKAFELEEATQ